MDREKFKKAFSLASPEISPQDRAETIERNLQCYEGTEGSANLIVVMEEFAEAAQEVSRYLRGRGDKMSLLEEMADAMIGIWYVQKVCELPDEDLNKAINAKLAYSRDGWQPQKKDDGTGRMDDRALKQAIELTRDTMDGEMNRIQVSDDPEEVSSMKGCLIRNAEKLASLNKEKLSRRLEKPSEKPEDILPELKLDLNKFEPIDTQGECMEGAVEYQGKEYFIELNFHGASYEAQTSEQIRAAMEEGGVEIGSPKDLKALQALKGAISKTKPAAITDCAGTPINQYDSVSWDDSTHGNHWTGIVMEVKEDGMLSISCNGYTGCIPAKIVKKEALPF